MSCCGSALKPIDAKWAISDKSQKARKHKSRQSLARCPALKRTAHSVQRGTVLLHSENTRIRRPDSLTATGEARSTEISPRRHRIASNYCWARRPRRAAVRTCSYGSGGPQTRKWPPRCISRRKSSPATAGSARARSTCSTPNCAEPIGRAGEGRYGRAIVLASIASLRVDAFVSSRGELLTRRKVHPADRFRFRMAVATSRASRGGRRCSHSLTAASAKSEESGDTER
jgi:hypothetical protein